MEIHPGENQDGHVSKGWCRFQHFKFNFRERYLGPHLLSLNDTLGPQPEPGNGYDGTPAASAGGIAWNRLGKWWFLVGHIWVFPKIGGFFPPNHPLKNRVFHYFYHPFWGFFPYFWKRPHLHACVFFCHVDLCGDLPWGLTVQQSENLGLRWVRKNRFCKVFQVAARLDDHGEAWAMRKGALVGWVI